MLIANKGTVNEAKYLINANWWRKWANYVSFDSENE
jgi:hypothetical protein